MTDSPPRKRVRHYDGEGHARELTFSCFQRRAYFAKPYVYEWFFKALAKARRQHPIQVWAYVVMPEHVHLLVWPTVPEFEISDLLETVKSSVSKRARNHLLRTKPEVIEATGGEFHFWQAGSGYDRNLDHEASIWAAIDYFHMNPVRRDLCSRPEDWPWSSAGIYAGLRDGPFPIDRDSLPPLDVEQTFGVPRSRSLDVAVLMDKGQGRRDEAVTQKNTAMSKLHDRGTQRFRLQSGLK